MKRLIQAIFCSVLVLAFNGCQINSFICSGTEPAHFIGDFYSYQTFDEFERIVQLTNDSIVVIENSRLDSTDTRPQFDNLHVSTPDYMHLGVSGRMEALFYNDRLQAIIFYPNDTTSYLNALKDSLNLNLLEDPSINQGCVRILYRSYFKNDFYIIWRDKRLDKEQEDWISRFA